MSSTSPGGPFPADDPLSESFRAAVGRVLDEVLAARAEQLGELDPLLPAVLAVARELCRGGKRLRPGFCYWAFAAVAGQPEDPTGLLRVGASLELLHAGVLVHDDLIDASATRRGHPAAHREFAGWVTGPPDLAESFGTAGAVLLGVQLIIWSTALLDASGLPALERARPVVEAMRDEVLAGQWLDVAAQAGIARQEGPDRAAALIATADRVVEYKTSRYTVQRPLQLGASLAGADQATLAGLALFGGRIGRAFQYRDDLLGVFGAAEQTGKPSGDDLREGKRTALVGHTLAGLSPRRAARFGSLLGQAGLADDQLEEARELIISSGAVRVIEQQISEDLRQGLEVLAGLPLTAEGGCALRALARASAERQS